MADYTSSPQGGGYYADSDLYDVAPRRSNPLANMTNIAGAALSAALVIGIGVWGYKLLVRDVTGIPIVRAAQGDMRVRPENPGGQLAQNQGLSVNAVASEGTADQVAERVILAPRPLDLDAEDQPVLASMVAPVPQAAAPIPSTPDVSAALNSGNVDDLVAQLTEDMEPMDTGAVERIKASVSIDAAAIDMAVSNAIAVAMVAEPGVKASLRPKTRPAVRAVVTQAAFDTSASATEVKELSADSLPTGTRLVQLGAFDTPEIARSQWDKLNGRFGAYLQGKSRIVQEASSGGRTFYRLRAHGFQDIADARRFCSALVAENADCIPVVTR